MVSSYPYNRWPLRELAVKCWRAANDKNTYGELSSLPAGFTCVTSLEGVDGKSGQAGSGRTGHIDVKDGEHGLLFSQGK
jgi:structure-specific endonuclease subunit SLX1